MDCRFGRIPTGAGCVSKYCTTAVDREPSHGANHLARARIAAALPDLCCSTSPHRRFKLTYEDRDLLKTLGRHVATYLAQHESERQACESRQFEAYNKLTTFMMHD